MHVLLSFFDCIIYYCHCTIEHHVITVGLHELKDQCLHFPVYYFNIYRFCERSLSVYKQHLYIFAISFALIR